MTNAIQNFQIPVFDFQRAHKFYSFLMGYELEVMEYAGARLGIFQYDAEKGGVGGNLIQSEGLKPSAEGTMVYLDAGNDLQPHLDRTLKAGGEVLVEKTSLGPEMGFFAIIKDTEGNSVGFYSRS